MNGLKLLNLCNVCLFVWLSKYDCLNPGPAWEDPNYSEKRTTQQKSFWALREKVSKWTKLRNKFNKVFEDFAKLARKGIRKLYGLVSKIKNFVDFNFPNRITNQHGQTMQWSEKLTWAITIYYGILVYPPPPYVSCNCEFVTLSPTIVQLWQRAAIHNIQRCKNMYVCIIGAYAAWPVLTPMLQAKCNHLSQVPVCEKTENHLAGFSVTIWLQNYRSFMHTIKH